MENVKGGGFLRGERLRHWLGQAEPPPEQTKQEGGGSEQLSCLASGGGAPKVLQPVRMPSAQNSGYRGSKASLLFAQ